MTTNLETFTTDLRTHHDPEGAARRVRESAAAEELAFWHSRALMAELRGDEPAAQHYRAEVERLRAWAYGNDTSGGQ